jgi:hypothetical protein
LDILEYDGFIETELFVFSRTWLITGGGSCDLVWAVQITACLPEGFWVLQLLEDGDEKIFITNIGFIRMWRVGDARANLQKDAPARGRRSSDNAAANIGFP